MRVRPVARRANLIAALDRLGAGVGEEDPLDARMSAGDQRLGQEAGQQGAVHLHQVGQVGIDRLVERLFDGRVGPAQREHAEAGQQVEVTLARRRRTGSTLRPGRRTGRTRGS